MNRETGYYWCKILPDAFPGNKADWHVLYYSASQNNFYAHSYYLEFSEHEIVQINETRIKNPDEQ